MGEKIALGRAPAVKSGLTTVCMPETNEELLNIVAMRVDELTRRLNSIQDLPIKNLKKDEGTNDDGLIIGNSLMGTSTKSGTHILTIGKDGYYIGPNKYGSLSAAAEASSGVRRSGWTYWKFPDGRTVKEALGKV